MDLWLTDLHLRSHHHPIRHHQFILSLCFVLLVATLVSSVQISSEQMNACMASLKTYNKCNFYTDCLEKIIPCGSNGYALGYGHKYCSKFFSDVNAGKYHTDYSKRWVASTGHCLQQVLMDNIVKKINNGWSCKSMIDFAFDSHPACYTGSVSVEDQQEYSICKIRNVFDLKTVVATVDAKDLFSMRSMKQMVGVVKNCMSQVLPFDEVSELDQYIEN